MFTLLLTSSSEKIRITFVPTSHSPTLSLVFYLFSPLYKHQKVPIPEEPDGEDQEELKQWKWKFKEANKENSERHSQRCDVELKLEVRKDSFMLFHSFLLL